VRSLAKDKARTTAAKTAARGPAPAVEHDLRTASRAVGLAEKLRQPNRRRRARLVGDFAQAFDDGAVDHAERSLERRVRAHLARGMVNVTLTDNRYTMISVKRGKGSAPAYNVRLHHMFADAGPAITRALARYVARNDSDASKMLGDYIDAHQHRVRTLGRSQRVRLVTMGDHHDLQSLFDELNATYFGGTIEARITWGQRSKKPRRRNSIKMGSYSVEDRLIRIHRSLDRSFVPRFFVAWIVYHEMLHQVHEVQVVGGRRQFHPPAFLAQEAEFEQYEAAREWQSHYLDALLTY
jgi:hypothetical protein